MVNPNVGIHQNTTRGFERVASIGQVADNHPLNRRAGLINQYPQAVQTSTLTLAAGQASYDLVVGGVAVTLTASAASAAAAATALAASWNATPVLRGWMSASANSNVVTLTGLLPGMVIDITESEADITLATTAADEADPVDFGRAMIAAGFATPASNNLDPDGEMPRGVQAQTAYLTAQQDQWTIADPGTGQFIGLRIEMVGHDVPAVYDSVPWATDLDTTLDNLATVINGQLTDLGLDSYVTVDGPSGDAGTGEIWVTAVIEGVEFRSVVTCDDAAGYPAATLSSNKAQGTSFYRGFAGVSIRATDEVPSTVGGNASQYGANRGVRVLQQGPIWVDNSQSLSFGDTVYVGLSSSEKGKFFNTAATDRLPLPKSMAIWLRSARSESGDELGLLRVNAPVLF